MNATDMREDLISLAVLDAETVANLKVRRRPERPPILVRLIALFLPRAETDLAEAGEALARSDIEAVRERAHSLKGASLQIGALAFAAKAKLAEDSARCGDQSGADAAIGDLVEGFPLLRAALEDIAAELGAG